MRGIAAAQLLEEILFGEKEGQGAAELSGAGEFQRKLEAGIDSVKKMDRKKLKASWRTPQAIWNGQRR